MKTRIATAIIIASALVGCSEEKATNPEQAAAIARGSALFIANCQECHPRTGRGDYLKRIPATLLTRRSEQELVAWIQGSDKHREMPNFTNLSDQEKRDLASYLFNEVGK